jgi:DnaK suppressor protein
MDERQARALVAAERARIESTLNGLIGDVSSEGALKRQQTGDHEEGGELATEMVESAMVAALRAQLIDVERAEARIAAGTYGRSVESGAVIPDERLEAEPLAERTIEEQERYEAGDR